MTPLASELRRELDRSIGNARTLAETGARAAIARLGVESDAAPGGQSPEQRDLRVQLRARLRAIGKQGLVEEIAYEQWHRMLFARFLAENGLLIHPEGAPVTLAEVRELADEEGERDMWVLAARYAAAMLPGIFRADDPANRVTFAPEDRSRLEAVLEALPASLFTADDALGWVYQFWQSQRKDEVNKRGDKIGGADLPPVTQLFTEHYMVRFLLENSLGAWWAGRHPDSPLLREWEYLRFRDDGTPAAGTFEGWPSRAAEVTVMDPCCGSGHFLVAAADMLRKMRSEEEGLTSAQAAVAVIRDNLFGLELDARCLQLAAFNLALDAWKAAGFQPLPIPNLACSGIAIKGQRAEWHRLAGDDDRMRQALDRLHDLFQDAPELGSLIDPRSAAGEGLWRVDTDDLLAKLDQALSRETASDPAAAVFGAAAAGTARAARLLSGRYWLVATNPPFLGANRQSEVLVRDAEAGNKRSTLDLAYRMSARASDLGRTSGCTAVVLPSEWLMSPRFKEHRADWLKAQRIALLARLGYRAFETGLRVNPLLQVTVRIAPSASDSFAFVDVPVSANDPSSTARAIRSSAVLHLPQLRQLNNRDAIVSAQDGTGPTVGDIADCKWGLGAGDGTRFERKFWEVPRIGGTWEFLQGSAENKNPYSGRSTVVLWEGETGAMARLAHSVRHLNHKAQQWRSGKPLWGRSGVALNRVGKLRATIYSGDRFGEDCIVIGPADPSILLPLWAFAESGDLEATIRSNDRTLAITPGSIRNAPFDLEHWQQIAAEQYPDGLPEPHSDDPTQWLFKGNIVGSEAPLQVAVARLLGYRWPDQEPDALDSFADADGLVPLPSVGGERSAAERLRDLLARAYGDAWSPALLDRLLAEAGSPGKTLETWLRDDFFAQHVKLFQNRPFIWHVWDGRREGGFSVLCHYHRLDRARLERLTFTLLGDWIERQRAASNEPGAESRLAAALGLQDKLKLILEGEPPHDIYVRWKSLAEQPIGWEPDLDDGVRLNIRPFVTAEVLRAKVNVKWDKDRGKDPDGSERINDRHPTLAQKRAASAAAGR